MPIIVAATGASRGFAARGTWAPSTAYVVNDIVTYNGATYRVTAAHTSGTTFSTANLEAWALRGNDGPPGRGFTPRGTWDGGTPGAQETVPFNTLPPGWTPSPALLDIGGVWHITNPTQADATTSTFTWEFTTGAGTVLFDFESGTEAGYDFVTVTMDGTDIVPRRSGQHGKAEFSREVSSGTHTLVFKYEKDGSTAAWIDGWRLSNFRKPGAGTPGPTYNADDLVTYAGETWRALRSSVSITPSATNNLDWERWAAKGIAGPTGPAGAAGPAGPAGATGPAGPAGANGRGFTPRGAWAASTAYALDDVLTHDGQTYRAVQAFTSGTTFATTDATLGTLLEVWATKGAAGATGPAGPAGASPLVLGAGENAVRQVKPAAEPATSENTAAGQNAAAFGMMNKADGSWSFASGVNNQATGTKAVAMGTSNVASANNSAAFGQGTDATAEAAFASGSGAEARGIASHAEGIATIAYGQASHTEGDTTRTGAAGSAGGANAHAEGRNTVATGTEAHAEGLNSQATANQAHAEGDGTVASGLSAHAEGLLTDATGNHSHAEGRETLSSGAHSHAQGTSTVAGAFSSHAEGVQSNAWMVAGHAHANGVFAATGDAQYQRVIARVEHTGGTAASAAQLLVMNVAGMMNKVFRVKASVLATSKYGDTASYEQTLIIKAHTAAGGNTTTVAAGTAGDYLGTAGFSISVSHFAERFDLYSQYPGLANGAPVRVVAVVELIEIQPPA